MYFYYKGKKLELLDVSEVAKVINRSSATIRHWERNGILPEPKFKSKYGRRYYLKEEVDFLKKIIEEENIKAGKSIKYLTNFIYKIKEGWSNIRKKLDNEEVNNNENKITATEKS